MYIQLIETTQAAKSHYMNNSTASFAIDRSSAAVGDKSNCFNGPAIALSYPYPIDEMLVKLKLMAVNGALEKNHTQQPTGAGQCFPLICRVV